MKGPVPDGPVVASVRSDGWTFGTGTELLVVSIEPTGAETRLLPDAGGALLTLVTRHRLREQAGDRIRVSPDQAAVHLFDPLSALRRDGRADQRRS